MKMLLGQVPQIHQPTITLNQVKIINASCTGDFISKDNFLNKKYSANSTMNCFILMIIIIVNSDPNMKCPK